MNNKKSFIVEIRVEAIRQVDIEADTAEEAEKIAYDNFGNGDPLIDDREYSVDCNVIAEVSK